MPYENILNEYYKKGLIKKQNPDFNTIEKLILRAQKDLTTAQATIPIDEGIAYSIAYLAMLHAGRAMMLLKGYRPADGYQHKTVVEFMGYILGKDYQTLVERFDRMRKKRNVFIYEVSLSISHTEAANALDTARKFVNLI